MFYEGVGDESDCILKQRLIMVAETLVPDSRLFGFVRLRRRREGRGEFESPRQAKDFTDFTPNACCCFGLDADVGPDSGSVDPVYTSTAGGTRNR